MLSKSILTCLTNVTCLLLIGMKIMHFLSQISAGCKNMQYVTHLKRKAPFRRTHCSITSKPHTDCSPMALILISFSPPPLSSLTPTPSPTYLSFNGLASDGTLESSWCADPVTLPGPRTVATLR